MLTAEQKQLIHAIEQLDLPAVQAILAKGLDPNFIDAEKGPPVSIICDRLFVWWEEICDAYEAGQPLTEEEKTAGLQVYLDILETLIQADANLHLWDSEEFYGPLWDAASAACVPAVQRLLQAGVDPNTKDDQDLTILSSISDLWFDCDFDEIDWNNALPEEQATLTLLRENDAKMSKEL
ncbi:ankyrin repeat domain-containing protein [Acinetobacter qingfengensis]|uniref:Uncharacterized protein n=1 Tax=Acinetobacter qingfengensis TaxID=1262585 RepID=A0A1E7RCS1_9GAMM|nr:ankyrin repeat domain-containing protein [Acinetobacter qingfengensis]KAA8732049.1 ankyrin repeat domain-containing protein [Acinetobacter qingfengensis]OEY97131.1 hypothetical protein BJI46_01485 [Acinetobacter qingfengensis]